MLRAPSGVWRRSSGSLGAAPADGARGARQPIGVGIKDGRGYGPYGMGYYYALQNPNHRVALPIGPNGERLGPEYDFIPNEDGSYIYPRPPRVILPGSHLGAAPADGTPEARRHYAPLNAFGLAIAAAVVTAGLGLHRPWAYGAGAGALSWFLLAKPGA